MFLMKTLLLGDIDSGKDRIREKFFRQVFTNTCIMAIGAEFGIQKVYINGYEVKLQLWDLDGRERFNGVRSLYYSGSHGAIFVFNVNRRNTFDNILRWVEELHQHLRSRSIPVILVGNNLEFREQLDQNRVRREEGEQLATQISQILSEGQNLVPYIEISPLIQETVQEPFLLLAETIINFPVHRRTVVPAHEPVIIEPQTQFQITRKNPMPTHFYAKSLYQGIYLHAEHCIADRKLLNTKELETAYYCTECKHYTCIECLTTIMQSKTPICLGSFTTTKIHLIDKNFYKKNNKEISIEKSRIRD